MRITLKLSREENLTYHGGPEVEIDLEEYLLGVVPSEIGNAPVEACAAQAIAARTFTINQVAAKGYITDNSSVDQAYRASRLTGYENAYKGVRKTQHLYLSYDKKIAKTFYSHSNGGRVRSYYNVWGGRDYPYLQEKTDPYDNGKKNGHGVGLSQTGAIAMANQGEDFEDILQFYFPGAEVISSELNSMTEKEKTIIDWARSKIGCGYVWGGAGQVLTQSELNRLSRQYPQYVSQEKNGKWLNKQVFDCASFVSNALKEIGVKFVNGASSQWFRQPTKWAEQDTIDKLPRDKVCILYRQTSSTVMQHTGIYCGDGKVIDARGSNSGVIESALSSYKWTHYGIPKGLVENKNDEVIEVLYEAKVVAASGTTVNMRMKASSSGAIVERVPVGAIVDVLEETNADWRKIMYKGTQGYMMTKFLESETNDDNDDPEEKFFYIKIKCANEAEARKFAELMKNVTVAEE